MPCCAQFSLDDHWYRARITKVYFVDLGYKEVLPLCRIHPIEQDLLKQSAQAIHCSLKDIVAPSVWPANALRHFEDMTIGKELVLNTSYGQMDSIAAKMTRMLLSICVILAAILSNACVDILDLAVAPGTSENVFVTYVTSFRKFCCQVTRGHPEFDHLMWQMESHYTTLDTDQEQLREPVVGTFCAAKFSPDDSWCRGKILDVHGKTITLQFLEFGTSGSLSASKIKVLQPEFGALPCQVFECSLERSWGVSDVQFKELSGTKNLKLRLWQWRRASLWKWNSSHWIPESPSSSHSTRMKQWCQFKCPSWNSTWVRRRCCISLQL